jgi:hypothetical protein
MKLILVLIRFATVRRSERIRRVRASLKGEAYLRGTPTRSGAYSYPLLPTPTPVSRWPRFVAVYALLTAETATKRSRITALQPRAPAGLIAGSA